MTTLKNWLSWLIQVRHNDPNVVRRGRLLNLFWLIGAGFLVVMIGLSALRATTFAGLITPQQFVQRLWLFGLLLLVDLLFLLLTRRGFGLPAGYATLILILALTSMMFQVRYFLLGPGPTLYVMVIFAASVAVSPLAGPLFSILAALNLILMGLRAGVSPTASSVVALLAAGVIAWIIAQYLERASRDLAQQNEFYQELNIARQTQTSLLPAQAPRVEGFDVAGYSIPSKNVGGDFYNFYLLDTNRLVVVVGDVSGKGMPAALLMAVATGAIGTAVLRSSYPAAFMREVEQVLQPHASRSKLSTALCYALLDGTFHTLQVCNAGLISPLLRGNGRADYLEAEGLPLGFGLYDAPRDTLSLQIDENDLLVLVTDGVVEVRNDEGELFSFDRLAEVIEAVPETATAQEVIDHLLQEIRAFSNGVDWPDDVTIVAVRVL